MLSIFYTNYIRGNLDLLPRLYTFIKALRGRGDLAAAGRPYEIEVNRFLLLDLGNSCSPEVWHCVVTSGRSTLIVMDAMGYHAARVSLDADSRDKLRDNLLGLTLVDDEHPWQDEAIFITSGFGRGGSQTVPYALQIVLFPAAETRLDGLTLSLAGVNAGQVGMAMVSDKPTLLTHTIYDMPSDTLPDPTITATIDFVLNEARLLQRKRQG
jgi:hypothetical protein